MIPIAVRRLVRQLYPGFKRRGPLKVEMQNIRANISSTEHRLSDLAEEFERGGWPCCPDCAFPEHASLVARQRRRKLRLQQLEAKIQRDEQTRSV